MKRVLPVALILFPAIVSAAPPAVTCVAYQPDGKRLAAGVEGTVRFFDPANGNQLRPHLQPGGSPVTALAFDRSGKLLVIATGKPGEPSYVHFWRIGEKLSESAPIGRVRAAKDTIYTLAVSPDGKKVASAGYDRVVRVWDVAKGSDSIPVDPKELNIPILALTDHSDTVYAIAWHADGKLLATASADRSVKVWDAATGKRLYTLNEPTDWVYCLAWSPDKKHLAAGGVDRSVRIWATNADGARLVVSAFAHEKSVWRLVYSADGKTLYTAGEDRLIKSWDAARLVEKKVFEAQKDSILDLALRPDGKQLAVARFDGVLTLLDPATGKPTAQPLPAKPLPPLITTTTPSAGIRGTTTRVVVSGDELDHVKSITTSSPAVRASIANARRTPTRLEIDISSTAAAPLGKVQLTLDGDGGKSSPIAFFIDRFGAVAESGMTDSSRTAQEVKLPVTVVGTVDRAGDVDYYRFDAKAGDEIGIQATTAELGSKLQPVLQLTDANGSILAEGAGVLGFRSPRAGTYSVALRDRAYNGGGDYSYRLHIGRVPVVTGVFPLAVQRGHSSVVHVDGVNLGQPGGVAVTVKPPADAAIGSRFAVSVPTTPTGEKPLNPSSVTIAEFPSAVVDPLAGASVRVPGSADGILNKPNHPQVVRFHAKKGETLVVESLARRAGSPVDPVIEILDDAGKPVPRAILRATSKTFTVFRDHDSAGPGIRIETWNDLAIDDYLFVGGELMRIVALPKNPDDDCQFYQVAGRRVGYLGATPTQHAQGSIMYKVEIHPPGSSFPPNGLPLFPINYVNDDGGAGFDKDSYLLFDPPADGEYQVRISDARGDGGPTHAYRVTVRPPKPDFAVSFNPTTPSVWKGGGIPVNVTVSRLDGFDGQVHVKLEGLPKGLHAPATFVEAGHTTTALTLFADADAVIPPKSQIKLVATATIGGKEVVREAKGGTPKLVLAGDLVATTMESEIVVTPGRETRFTVNIERRGKFAGRVPLEVRGLPHGVRVLNIGLNGILITERESSREVVLFAEPWVKPMEHPIVVFARREGTSAEHAAKSVLLRVQK